MNWIMEDISCQIGSILHLISLSTLSADKSSKVINNTRYILNNKWFVRVLKYACLQMFVLSLKSLGSAENMNSHNQEGQ